MKNWRPLFNPGRASRSQHEIYSGSVYAVHVSNPMPSGVYFVTAAVGDILASARTVVISR
ncbi:MAG: hypothetical protein KAR40_16555 [Candidatus Sabulitectum sp.]|nr:hypothetical protein [Candidatus Sabulitectum sp.]